MAETVLITGASRGIGAETARRFAQAGYRVAINYCRSAQRAEALAAEINAGGGTALAVQADVAARCGRCSARCVSAWVSFPPWSIMPA